MWSYICYIQVFLVLIYAIQERSSVGNNNYSHDEKIFADVIKNISRVNNVLQELITNYEQLQKIYKSEEIVEKDYSSDAEIDQTYKNMKSKKKKRGDINNSKEKLKELDYFPATQIIWSEEDGTNDDSLEEPQKEITKNLKINQSKQERISVIKDVPAMEEEIITENTSDEFKEKKEYKIEETPKKNEILFIDTYNKRTTQVKNETHIAILNKRPKMRFITKVSQKPTTKRKKKRVTQKYKNIKLNHVLKQNNITKKIKRIVYAEAFSPKTIWSEILQNKPIQLKAQQEPMYGRNERKDLENWEPNLRSVEGKSAFVILTKNKKTEMQESSQSTEDEGKELFKTNVLRKAYGDACLKVVVKKCYKACKLVSKAVCARYSCKSKFKERFKESSKTGCIKEFREVSVNNKTVSRNTRGNTDFSDATRVGFLAICHTHDRQKQKLRYLKNGTQLKNTNPNTKFDKEINILRDRYEKACRRASAEKCISACNYASKSTCDTFACAKGLKKSYKKYCKKQCRAVYSSGRGKSSSESSTSSDTDSSSSDTSISHT